MTACVNRKHSRRAAAVISASLVGALSVGAPAVAMAQGTGVETLSASEVDEIKNSSISAATDQDGQGIDLTEDIVFTAADYAQYVVPTEVTNKLGDPIKVDGTTVRTVYYVADANGSKTLKDGTKVNNIDAADIKHAGTYYAGVYHADGMGDDTNVTFVKFTIVNRSLDGATIVDGIDVNDTSLEYIGKPQQLSVDYNVALNGEILEYGQTADYVAVVTLAGDATNTPTSPENAGDYVIRITGKGVYAGDQIDIPFKVVPLNLSTAALTFDAGSPLFAKTTSNLPVRVVTIDGVNSSDIDKTGVTDDDLQFKFIGASDASLAGPKNGTKGSFTYELSVKSPDKNKNVTGSQQVTVVRYENDATFQYDDDTWPATVKKFDAALISVKDSSKKDVPFTVSYQKQEGAKWVGVTEEATKLPGTYKAVVTAVSDDYSFGGMKEVQFTVNAIDVQDADVYVTYKGDVVDSISDIYSGSDLLENVSVRAFDEDGKEVPAEELVVKVVDENKKEVSEVVNEGRYTLTVETKKDSMYAIKNAKPVPFIVEAVNTSASGNARLRLSGTLTYGDDNAYAYTGSAIVPTFEYDLTKAPYDKAEDWKALPESSYKLTYGKWNSNTGTYDPVDECVEMGSYKVTLTDAAKDSNHVVSGAIEFTIDDRGVFADVANDHWAAEEIYEALENKYMGGYAGTQLFGPSDSLTRAQAAVVLFNMAGGKNLDPANYAGVLNQYKAAADAAFSDVDSSYWGATEIGWAVSTGVVTGYQDGSGNFGPDDTITREQFAIMLANYAKLTGEYEAVDADEVLSGIEGGDEVDSWAKEEVAWAVSEGVMGKGADLDPLGEIERAQVAIMAVRFQPDAMEDGDFIRPKA